MGWHQILNLFYFLLFFHSPLLHISCINPYPESPAHPATPLLPPPPPRPPSAPCPPDQRDALLYFANSFVIDSTASPSDCPMLSRPRTKSWNEGVDCCWWDEVICDYITGNIIRLDISCSWLRGTLHPNISFLLPELQYLLMSYNSISGKIPRWFWGMNHDTMEALDISQNQLEGGIPHLHWKRLSYLNLSSNHLTGPIPLALGNLTNLGWLDLSLNKLSGVIPRKLGDLTFLGYLNLSKNQLIGRIPQDKQLSTFSNGSFNGNPSLCGTPLSKACPGDAQPPPPSSSSTFDQEGHENWYKQKVVWMGYASGIIIGISIAYIAFETRRPKWLAQGVRMLERRVAKWMEKPKQKAIKFHK
ncbi:hypothetical protein BT93_C2528 [Corymbia citriodora subsp. variegata]|nr:hypothetical protein BT93_C2528 [Corymbia citriodora subsp. variegata]